MHAPKPLEGLVTASSNGHRGFVLNVDLSSDATPPLGDLRRSVRRSLSHLDTDCVEDAELLVTELVSNAYDHGRPPVKLRLCQLPNSLLHIDVEDSDRTHLPRLRASAPGGERGRGLLLVDQLSRGWGFNVTATNKVVWAEMNCRELSPAGRS
ncbi:ATP-binding protein [Lentzea aerocolonigenes]|uniref:ATP-binding protein n=1 Tax=Lentzea aerocolonigenes TaxID=68170 RepID=UPI0009DEC2E0|nr:ATP-binding protein [Lentzea aerocolonigenes]